MNEKLILFLFTLILCFGVLYEPTITGNIVYSSYPDLTVERILTHGVDTETQDFFVYYYIQNNGEETIKKGTEISTRLLVRYTAPPVTHEGSTGSITTAEIFFEEEKATYILEQDLESGETVLVASPCVSILLSTVRFFEKYDIKNKITLEIDSSRKIKESNEKNNKYTKWYYMQEWNQPEDIALTPS